MIVTYGIFTNITNMTYDLASLNGVCSFTLFYSRMKSFSCCLHKFQNDSVFHISPLPVTHTHAHISAGTCPECKNRHAKCLRNQNTWILNLSLAATNPLEFLQSVTKNIFFSLRRRAAFQRWSVTGTCCRTAQMPTFGCITFR